MSTASARPAATAQRISSRRSPAFAARARPAVLSRLTAIDNRSPPIEQAGDHQPEREGDEQAGDRALLDLSLNRLRCRPAAMTDLVGEALQPLAQLLDILLRGVAGAARRVAQQALQGRRERADVGSQGVEILTQRSDIVLDRVRHRRLPSRQGQATVTWPPGPPPVKNMGSAGTPID